MMKLEPIDRNGDLTTALALLAEGFPARPASFWREGLRRAAAQGEVSGVPAGQILVSKGVPSGVILTFGSRRPDRNEPVINLSAWYVRDTHRFLAPMMLKTICSGPGTFVDLTPTAQVVRLSQSLGFRPVCNATAVVPLPVAALRPGKGAVRPWRELDLPQHQMDLANDHAALGCSVLGIALPQRSGLIVSRPIRYFRLPAYEVVYADRTLLKDAIGPVARHLLQQGVAALVFDCQDRRDAPLGAFFRRSQTTRLVKGDGFGDMIDYAWSELPFLNP
jgi:hypothetical protein